MKTLYKYLAFGVLVVTLHACKKELGTLPKNAKVDANTILDQGTAQIALNGAYYTFANATQTKTGWQFHEIEPATLAGYLGYGYGAGPDEENMNGGLSNYWAESYVLLNATNGVIKGIDALADNKFTGNRKKEMLGEAHFLRAYGHFKLLSYYAEWYKPESALGVLLRDELSTLTNIVKARSTVAESYDFILADLDDAIANAPSTNPNYYVTKWAAMVLKMRVLINRGTTADYTEVINLANTVMQGPYALEDNPEDIFRQKGLASTEVILGIKPQALQTSDPYSKSKQYWPGASALFVAKGALESLYANDPRQSWVVGVATPYQAYSPNTFYFTKYNPVGGDPSMLSETDYAIRLTEVYLLKAEAIVRSGGDLDDAKALVHTIQAKAGITADTNSTNYLAVENANSPDDLLIEIYKETSRSLVAEDGMEWMALLRLPFNTVKILRSTITSTDQYIFPIPVNEFKYNPSFGIQNPGYATN